MLWSKLLKKITHIRIIIVIIMVMFTRQEFLRHIYLIELYNNCTFVHSLRKPLHLNLRMADSIVPN